MNVRTIRDRLGISQSELALLLGCSKSSVRNWERGEPISLAWQRDLRNIRRKRLIQLGKPTRPRVYDRDKAVKYLAGPGKDWIHWSLQRRASWWAQRRRYQRLLADPTAQPRDRRQSGTVLSRLLDRSPDLDTF